ncbi:MAG: phage Gp37/Gp68 family protein [Rhodobacteraceae bacterium]|nr:phage Gp37/Gp68 family protein [Paracoccaceae bacterium]
MAEISKIEWTDATWNPITGCTMVSAGCTNCYAMGLAATRLRHHPSREGLTRMTGSRAVWTGEVRLNEQWLDQPLRWKRGRMIFVCAHGDLFHENVPDEWIDRVFAVMALAPQHTFQVLTKRPERARAYLLANPGIRIRSQMPSIAGPLPVIEMDWPLPNVWLGTSIEDQATADGRIPDLLSAPAAVRFVSAEPLLGPVNLNNFKATPEGEKPHESDMFNALTGLAVYGPLTNFKIGQGPKLDWVIVGGESGPGARPMHPDWARSLRDHCQAAGVAFFFKQMSGARKADLQAIPDDLIIREMPYGQS